MPNPLFTLDANLSAEELADELVRIASMLRKGYTSGQTANQGLWYFNDQPAPVIEYLYYAEKE